MRRLPWAASLATTLVLAGCAAQPPLPAGSENPQYLERQARLAALRAWQVTGRIAFRISGDGGTGAMTWSQKDREMAFSFRGPIGAGAFRIDGSPPDLLLETGGGKLHYLSDPDAELRSHFGFTAPFESLRYWMVGMPDPVNAAVTTVDGEGLLRSLEQGGWGITYDKYHDDAPRLPRKLTLLRDDVRIRVIVDRWYLPDAQG